MWLGSIALGVQGQVVAVLVLTVDPHHQIRGHAACRARIRLLDFEV